MVYDRVEKFILNQISSEIEYEALFKEKSLSGSLSEKGKFCRYLVSLCKNLYYDKFFKPEPLLNKMNAMRLTQKWFFVRENFGKGVFCNADALFSDVYCEEKECHRTAFDFALKIREGKIQNICLKSGIIDPYDIMPSGIMHSICEFQAFGKSFVFDGANFLIMQKELYYKLFDFKEIQNISQERLFKDLEMISNRGLEKGIIKETSYQYKMISDSNLRKHFSEFGFMRYLYDRNSSMKSEQNLTGRNKIVMKKIVQITSANARPEVEVVKLETTKVPNMRHLKNEEVNI